MRGTLGIAAIALALSGCILDRSGTAGVDGGAAVDARDAGAGEEAGARDAGPDAVPDAGCSAAPSCDGERAVRCVDGAPVVEDCAAASGFCEGGACVDWVCTPGAVTCDDDTPVETRCDGRGAALVESPCTRGCVEGVGCQPASECPLEVRDTIVREGTVTLDTCGQGNDQTFLRGCTRVDISGPDVLYRLEVPARADYRIDLNAPTSGDDPVLYLRTACDDASTEVVCDDDRPGSWSSRVDVTLEPGDYFIVADTFADTDEGPEDRCGPMELVVQIL